MNLIEESFRRLFPEEEFAYTTELAYNRRLGNFNANIRRKRTALAVNLNLHWKAIDNEIKIGLIQHLLLKVFKRRGRTPNIALYYNFIKNAHLVAPKTKSDPILEASFQRMNEQFFSNTLERPNLRWGKAAFRKLASYNFHSDTITVSTLFQTAEPGLLDYLLYHEMLHKHLKFRQGGERCSYHSREFREAEKRYPEQEKREKEIEAIIRNQQRTLRRKKSFWGWL
ncbi:MAG: hypothetical protein Q8R53_01680 [Nanoarchaeota archaeon]|nr:hypothetical protein [Nanoarchaeota archaeon]